MYNIGSLLLARLLKGFYWLNGFVFIPRAFRLVRHPRRVCWPRFFRRLRFLSQRSAGTEAELINECEMQVPRQVLDPSTPSVKLSPSQRQRNALCLLFNFPSPFVDIPSHTLCSPLWTALRGRGSKALLIWHSIINENELTDNKQTKRKDGS